MTGEMTQAKRNDAVVAIAFLIKWSLMFCVIIPAGITYSGWVLTKLWAWFLCPVLPVNPLTVVQAVGLNILIGFFLMGVGIMCGKGKDREISFWAHLFSIALGLAIAQTVILAESYFIVRFFM